MRGRKSEVELPQVDFTYVDGDHTLRGIAIDLIRAWPKTRWLGGDDFGGVWGHGRSYEPNMVFPFAAHFAEAAAAPFEVTDNQSLIGGEGDYAYTGDTRLRGRMRSPTWLDRLMGRGAG